MRAVGQADGRRRPADLLHRHDVREIAHRGAAVFLLDGDSEEAEIADLAPQVRGKLVRAIDVGGARRDLVGGELPHACRAACRSSRRDRNRAQGSSASAILGSCAAPSSESDFPCMTISVCCMIATSVRLPAVLPCTSPRVITSVRPDLTTMPSATSRSPAAGASRLSLYSTVSTDESARKQRVARVAAGGIGDRRDHAGMNVAMLLRDSRAAERARSRTDRAPRFRASRRAVRIAPCRAKLERTRCSKSGSAGVQRFSAVGAGAAVSTLACPGGVGARVARVDGSRSATVRDVYVNVNSSAHGAARDGLRRRRQSRSRRPISTSTASMSSRCCSSIARRSASICRNLASCGRSLPVVA